MEAESSGQVGRVTEAQQQTGFTFIQVQKKKVTDERTHTQEPTATPPCERKQKGSLKNSLSLLQVFMFIISWSLRRRESTKSLSKIFYGGQRITLSYKPKMRKRIGPVTFGGKMTL